MASIDTTITDARGQKVPAVSMPGGAKLPGSAIVFRNGASVDKPVSTVDPLPVDAQGATIDADQWDSLLGQVAAVVTAVEALGGTLAEGVTAGLIALDPDTYPDIVASPGFTFVNLLVGLQAVNNHIRAVEPGASLTPAAGTVGHYVAADRVWLQGSIECADIGVTATAAIVNDDAEPASERTIDVTATNDADGTPTPVPASVVIGDDGTVTIAAATGGTALTGRVHVNVDSLSYRISDL